MIARLPATVLLALACGAAAAEDRPLLLLADAGIARLPVVLGAQATPAERTAAEELVRYLQGQTSATFELLTESPQTAGRDGIFVGQTAASAALGFEARVLGPEEWRIRTAGQSLVLTGGRPRGTLYAVYRFLEDQLGVRWWTPFDESVPRRDRLELAPLARAGRPALSYRDVHGVEGAPQFLAHARINGHYSFLPAALGGAEIYGPPFQVHDFFMYVPPDEYFATHPEFYSEIDGRRVHQRGQLCLTNSALLEVVAGKLASYIEQARRQAQERGEAPPRLFDFSQNDWAGGCRCDACRAVRRVEGGESGALVLFLDRLGRRIAERYPDVLLDTLAYQETLTPPRQAKLPANVTVRVSGLWQRDFMRPVTDRANRTYRAAIEGWRDKTTHLRIWDYSVTFGNRANNFPLPNLRVLAQDLRYYAAQGVEGLFLQHDHALMSDLRDLKLWVILKLVEDPTLDVERLIDEFATGYYGPAAPPLRRYLAELQAAAARSGAAIRYPTGPEQYRWLDPPFLLAAQALFDEAEDRAAGDAELVRRVRFARVSLDRATLWHWDRRLAQRWPAREVAARLLATVESEASRRLPGVRGAQALDELRAEVEQRLARIAGSAPQKPPGS